MSNILTHMKTQYNKKIPSTKAKMNMENYIVSLHHMKTQNLLKDINNVRILYLFNQTQTACRVHNTLKSQIVYIRKKITIRISKSFQTDTYTKVKVQLLK